MLMENTIDGSRTPGGGRYGRQGTCCRSFAMATAAGHCAGSVTLGGSPRGVRKRHGALFRCAPHLGIHTLTLFALSSRELAAPTRGGGCHSGDTGGIPPGGDFTLPRRRRRRLSIIGRRDRLPAGLRAAIADAEALTAKGKALHLRLAIDYSARQTIYQAASKFYKVTNLPARRSATYLPKCNAAARLNVTADSHGRRNSGFRISCSGNAPRGIRFFAEALAGLYAGGPAECCSGIRAARNGRGAACPGSARSSAMESRWFSNVRGAWRTPCAGCVWLFP